MNNLISAIILLIVISSNGQTKADSLAIKSISLDYVEGFYTSDTLRLKKGLSSDLVKRMIDNRNGTSKLVTIGLKELISYTKGGKVLDKNPKELFKAEVKIYDISNGIALAKITTNKMDFFFDYVQLGKINGEWKIINVLWAFTK